jgi:fructokinase
MSQFALQRLVVTRGEQGATAFEPGGALLAQPAAPPPERWGDAVGAGDSFASVLLAGRWLGWPLPLTLERASAFASAICGLDGAVPEDLGFYTPWRRAWGLA